MKTDTGTDTGSGGSAAKTGFLKLYDRRFARSLRAQEGAGKWTHDIEDTYVESIRTGSIQQFAHDLRHVEGFRDAQSELDASDIAQDEAYINGTMVQDHTPELAVHNALHDQQGKVVPRLLAAVDLDLTRPGAENDELFHIKGILLKYIEGFRMSKFPDETPPSAWQNIVDQAIAAVNVLGDYHILDTDRRPDNFIVTPDKKGGFRVFMVDFGCARFKREDESEAEWASNKITENEETGVGTVWQKCLARDYGFCLEYNPSDRWLEAGLEYDRALARVDIERYEKEKAEAT